MASGSLAIHEVSPPEQKARAGAGDHHAPARRGRPARSAIRSLQASVIGPDMALRWSGLSRVSEHHPGARTGDAQVGLGHARSLRPEGPERARGPSRALSVKSAPFHAQRCAVCAGRPGAVGSLRPGGNRGPVPAGFPGNIPVATTANRTSKEAVMAETWSGEFYCVKCKEKREAEGEVRVNDKGTRMAKAVCPVCGTNLNRILGKA